MLFRKPRRESPTFRRNFWRVFYRLLAAVIRSPSWAFMNYGWTAPDEPELVSPEDEPQASRRYALALYLHTAGAADLRGLDVLEVGCGRGGGAAAVAQRLGPKTLRGVDLSPEAIALCRRNHQAPGLSFLVGDAEALPLPDACVDAVINVESSHCYASMSAFLAEVQRVLRPGGHLLLADFRDAALIPELRGPLDRCGLELLVEEDITRGVALALDRSDADKVARVQSRVPPILRGLLLDFAAAEGSKTWADFHSGRKQYLRFVLRKPECP